MDQRGLGSGWGRIGATFSDRLVADWVAGLKAGTLEKLGEVTGNQIGEGSWTLATPRVPGPKYRGVSGSLVSIR